MKQSGKIQRDLLSRWNGVIRGWFVVAQSEMGAADRLVGRGLAERYVKQMVPMYRLTPAGSEEADRLGELKP